MFNTLGKLRSQIRYQFWAGLGHEGQTLGDLALVMSEIGNTVLEVDEANQRLLLVQMEGTEIWGCRLCLVEGALTITDSEDELFAHCDAEHPDWRAGAP